MYGSLKKKGKENLWLFWEWITRGCDKFVGFGVVVVVVLKLK